jgi:hypothetical protein
MVITLKSKQLVLEKSNLTKYESINSTVINCNINKSYVTLESEYKVIN